MNMIVFNSMVSRQMTAAVRVQVTSKTTVNNHSLNVIILGVTMKKIPH